MKLRFACLLAISPLIIANVAQKPLVLPVYVENVTERLIETATKQQTYIYGAPRLGNTSFFPSGPMGQQLVLDSLVSFEEENAVISERTREDIEDLMKVVDVVSTTLMFPNRTNSISMPILRAWMISSNCTKDSGGDRSLMDSTWVF